MNKMFIEQLNIKPIVEHISANYGKYGIVAIVIIALVVGVYLGYTPDAILAWLGV